MLGQDLLLVLLPEGEFNLTEELGHLNRIFDGDWLVMSLGGICWWLA